MASAWGVKAQDDDGAKSLNVFNEHLVQPGVGEYAGPSLGSVDAKGDFNASIPLLTVPGRGGLDYPVALSYTSGIRLDQQATWVGLGWNWDPGSIRRTVQGGVTTDREDSDPVVYGADFADEVGSFPDTYSINAPGAGGGEFYRLPQDGSAYQVHAPGQPTTASGWDSDFRLTKARPWVIRAQESGSAADGAVFGNASDWAWPHETKSGESWAAGPKSDYARFVVTTENGTRYVYEVPTLSTYLGPFGAAGFTIQRYVSAWRLRAILGPTYSGDDVPTNTDDGAWVRLDWAHIVSKFDKQAPKPHDAVFGTATLERVVTPTHVLDVHATPATHHRYLGPTAGRLDSLALYRRTGGGGGTGRPNTYAGPSQNVIMNGAFGRAR